MASECYPPPELNLDVPTNGKLRKKFKAWEELELPVDFLLLTVKDCEFLSCLAFLTDYVKSYKKPVGYFYIGNIDELKIAVMKCEKGSTGPGGSITAVKNAVAYLRPKAVFSVGFCGGLNYKKVNLGDVVVSAKLITYAPVKVTEDGIQERGIRIPPNKDVANLIKHTGDSWEPPLVNTEALEVKVHRDGVYLSGPEVINNRHRRQQLVKRYPEAIAVEMEGEGKSF